MSQVRFQFAERADDALAAVFAFLVLFLVANLLYAAKSIAGIDLFPGHVGSFFPLGNEIYRAVSGR